VVGGKRGRDISRENQVVRLSGDNPVESVTLLVSGLRNELFQVVVEQRKTNAFGIRVVRFIKVDV